MASIKRRPDGQWRARYRDEAGKEHARHFDRKVDAQRWLDEVTTSIVTGAYVDPSAGKVTFSAYYADWSARQLWSPGTRRAMDLAAKGVTFSDVPLKSIKRSHVEQWVKSLSHLAPGTVKTRFNNVRGVLRAAVSDRVIATDPSEGVTLPRVRRSEAAMQIPTTEQVGRLLGGAQPEFRGFVALAAFAGLRLGEIAALQPSDINFLGRTLTVSRQVQRETGGGVELRPPKYGSERTVYLPGDLVTLLSRHVEHHASAKWMFPGRDGHPWHQNTVGHHWRKVRDAAGLPGLKLHDLRHFYASGLIAAGCDVVTVQRALGHGSATVTLNTYAHLWPTAEDRTRAAAADMLSAALTPADSLRTKEI